MPLEWPPVIDDPGKANIFPFSSRSLAAMSGYSASHMAKFPRSASASFPFRRGRDGKTYPSRPLTAEQHQTLVLLVHGMKHDGLPLRAIQRRLREFGVHRSIGAISGYLNAWPCRCNVRTCTPEQQEHIGGPDAA